jgi:hypothetical protein
MTIYDEFKYTPEWLIIEQAIKDLEVNKDLIITTHPDYVIGYLCKKLKYNTKSDD